VIEQEQHSSLWLRGRHAQTYPPLQGALAADVAIVGAGITGLSAALLLKRAGLRVAVLEAATVAGDVSGHTTAHLTAAIDTRYSTLRRAFGQRGAWLAAQSSVAAIDQIAAFVDELQIACDFARVPGYLYSESADDLRELERELVAAREAGLRVNWVQRAPLPFTSEGAVQFEQQAQFNPAPYLAALARAVAGEGSQVFEGSRVQHVESATQRQVLVRSASGEVHAPALILATHAPIHDPGFLQDLLLIQSKVSPYRSYVLAARLRDREPPRGLFWDTDDPYHYIRAAHDEHGPLVIVGGEDHRTGEQSDTEACFERLEAYTRERFPVAQIAYRWSSQWYEPADGLPYIGKTPLPSPIWIATGYSGNGMTFGTLAGMLLAEQVQGRSSAWSELYAANRVKPLASAANLIAEGAKVVGHLLGDRVGGTRPATLGELGPGEGAVLVIDGQNVAAYRDQRGQLHTMSAVCTHAKCIVAWNSAEQSWDCPCHGGRYDALGQVLNGPPVCGLEPLHLLKR
jgi:glycine/D-amino acid oxidase-like deaminating enzyme/nitrite reductase/ring-hydroxylating ferredoxin subunit